MHPTITFAGSTTAHVYAAEKFEWKEQTLWLSPERCIFWEEQQALVASDLHFGKTGHFRKSGIAVPQHMYRHDLQRLMTQVLHFKPRQLIVVGDLFHSVANREVDLFERWRHDLPQLEIILVKGNHDILSPGWYRQAGITVAPHLAMAPFCFVHDTRDMCADENLYHFTGHLHPGICISGAGRQSLKFPCFYFARHFAILPAFGNFTGTVMVDPAPAESVFAILPANARRGELASVIKL